MSTDRERGRWPTDEEIAETVARFRAARALVADLKAEGYSPAWDGKHVRVPGVPAGWHERIRECAPELAAILALS